MEDKISNKKHINQIPAEKRSSLVGPGGTRAVRLLPRKLSERKENANFEDVVQ